MSSKQQSRISRYKAALEESQPGKEIRSDRAKAAEGEAAKLGSEIHQEGRAGKPRALTGDTAVAYKARPLRERRRTEH
jgi:hypothetical protein